MGLLKMSFSDALRSTGQLTKHQNNVSTILQTSRPSDNRIKNLRTALVSLGIKQNSKLVGNSELEGQFNDFLKEFYALTNSEANDALSDIAVQFFCSLSKLIIKLRNQDITDDAIAKHEKFKVLQTKLTKLAGGLAAKNVAKSWTELLKKLQIFLSNPSLDSTSQAFQQVLSEYGAKQKLLQIPSSNDLDLSSYDAIQIQPKLPGSVTLDNASLYIYELFMSSSEIGNQLASFEECEDDFSRNTIACVFFFINCNS
ncbi:hypothetical protein Ciccas_008727 [Cichlidogyrus casuarinus]|uniref:Uncharacterized protein n=1 Tax=Cichlidogyrus casuarinus TaxID=1844966 RepID=A0ABD2PZA0_9PLAT